MLLPEDCSGSVMRRRAGDICSSGQWGTGVVLGRLWVVTLMLCCRDPKGGKFEKSPLGVIS